MRLRRPPPAKLLPPTERVNELAVAADRLLLPLLLLALLQMALACSHRHHHRRHHHCGTYVCVCRSFTSTRWPVLGEGERGKGGRVIGRREEDEDVPPPRRRLGAVAVAKQAVRQRCENAQTQTQTEWGRQCEAGSVSRCLSGWLGKMNGQVSSGRQAGKHCYHCRVHRTEGRQPRRRSLWGDGQAMEEGLSAHCLTAQLSFLQSGKNWLLGSSLAGNFSSQSSISAFADSPLLRMRDGELICQEEETAARINYTLCTPSALESRFCRCVGKLALLPGAIPPLHFGT